MEVDALLRDIIALQKKVIELQEENSVLKDKLSGWENVTKKSLLTGEQT